MDVFEKRDGRFRYSGGTYPRYNMNFAKYWTDISKIRDGRIQRFVWNSGWTYPKYGMDVSEIRDDRIPDMICMYPWYGLRVLVYVYIPCSDRITGVGICDTRWSNTNYPAVLRVLPPLAPSFKHLLLTGRCIDHPETISNGLIGSNLYDREALIGATLQGAPYSGPQHLVHFWMDAFAYIGCVERDTAFSYPSNYFFHIDLVEIFQCVRCNVSRCMILPNTSWIPNYPGGSVEAKAGSLISQWSPAAWEWRVEGSPYLFE